VEFFFRQSLCPERKATIPHPSTAGTYRCPLKNSAKHKHSHVKTHRSKPYHHHNTTLKTPKGHKCLRINKKKKNYKLMYELIKKTF